MRVVLIDGFDAEGLVELDAEGEGQVGEPCGELGQGVQ